MYKKTFAKLLCICFLPAAVFAKSGNLAILDVSLGMDEAQVAAKMAAHCQGGIWYKSEEQFRIGDGGFLPLQYGCEIEGGMLIVEFLGGQVYHVKSETRFSFEDEQKLFAGVKEQRESLIAAYGKPKVMIVPPDGQEDREIRIQIDSVVGDLSELGALCWGNCRKENDKNIMLHGQGIATTLRNFSSLEITTRLYNSDDWPKKKKYIEAAQKAANAAQRERLANQHAREATETLKL